MSVQVRVSLLGEREVREALGKLARTGRSLRRPLLRSALHARRSAARRLRSREQRHGPSSGTLARSLTIRVDQDSFELGSNLRYAAIQQVGGDIYPRSVKALAIPVLPHLRRSGIWPRDLPRDSMRYVPVNRGNVVGLLVRARETDVVQADQPGARGPGRRPPQKLGETMYLLVRRSRIAARPYLAWDQEEARFLLGEVEREYRRAVGP